MAHQPSALEQSHLQEHGHPQPLEYVKIAVILSVITAVEVAIYNIRNQLGELFVPVLLVLSATKFGLVVLWFMHLKFDSTLFSAIFLGGLMLAGAILIALLFLFLAFSSPTSIEGMAAGH